MGIILGNPKELAGIVSVNRFGARGNGKHDDTAAIQAAINSLTGKEQLLFPPGTYLISDTIHVKGGIVYDFENSTVIFTGTGVCFDCSFTAAAPKNAYFKNLNLVMKKGSATQIGFNLQYFGGGGFANVTVTGGAYGIKSVNSWMWNVNNMIVKNPSYAGIYHQGDGGAEFYWSDVRIAFENFTGKYGIEIERTTTFDIGGYYLTSVLVVANQLKAGHMEHGIFIHSAAASRSPIGFAMVNGGVDGSYATDANAGKFGMCLKNVANLRITNAWLTTAAFENTEQTIFSDSYVPYGFWFKGSGPASHAFMACNINCNQNKAFIFEEEATVSNFYFKNVHPKAGEVLSDDMEKITGGYGMHANKVFVDQSKAAGMLIMENSADRTKRKHFSLNPDGNLLIHNNALSATLFELRETGDFSMQSPAAKLYIGGYPVLQKRITGWKAPAGTATRNGFTTDTATVKQVAEALKALIDDLTAHGLIGK